MANENDLIIEGLIKEVEKAKKEIANLEKEKFSYVTNCQIELDGTKTNIRVANKEKLFDLVTKLLKLKRDQSEAAKFLKIEPTETEINGFTLTEWLDDVKKAYKEKDIIHRKQELSIMEKELKDSYTEDKKVSNKLVDIAKRLKK